MKKIISNNRGLALLITILMISIIYVLTLDFNRSMRNNLHAAVNSKDLIMLNCLARSGYNFARAVLNEDDTKSDSFHDDWALLKKYSSESSQLFDEGSFQVEITDLSGRIQINKLINDNGTYNQIQKDMLLRLLLYIRPTLDSEKAEDIIDNIKDWIDSDNEPTRFGAENSYYQSLEKPYSCANAPLKSVEELLLVKGITPELFYGTSDSPGLKNFLTVYGDGTGRININTAPPQVIMAMSKDMDQEMVDDIIKYRDDKDNDLSSPFWYKKAIGTNEDIIDPSLITIKSSCFEIDSVGLKDKMQSGIRAVLKRSDNGFSLLSWEVL